MTELREQIAPLLYCSNGAMPSAYKAMSDADKEYWYRKADALLALLKEGGHLKEEADPQTAYDRERYQTGSFKD